MEKIAMVSETKKHPISTILIVVAMQTEALPIVNQLQLKEDLNSMFPKGVPWVRYHGTYKELDISIVWPGKDTVLGVDSVGTIPASLVTYVSIQALQPDLVINAGTAGGFKAKGATVGDTFLVSHVAFRDRRIPIPVFDLYGIGLRQAFSTPNLLRTLNLKVGKLSTSDSFEAPQEKASISENDATLEDMEGAAVAYVADVLKVPAVFIKAVTNIVDGDKPTIVEYRQNLAAVTAALGLAVAEVVDFINGKNSVTMKKKSGGEVMDGSDIMELVGNDQVYSKFVDHKFQELDQDCDGKLSVKELQPAVADIGAALGLPTQGASPDSDHIYSEVLSEFTHGKQEKVTKTEFKEVLSDILIGMAAGLKRDPIVILRIDGEDLSEFIRSSNFELEMVSKFSQIELPEGSLKDYIIKGFEKLTVEQGVPPASDSWVMSNIIEPAIQSDGGYDQQPISQEVFLKEFHKAAERVAKKLKEQPVIVAHTENTFDGSGIKRLLSNKFELDKTLEATMKNIPKDRHGKMPKEYLRVALDVVAPSAGLPPFGAVDEMDHAIASVMKMLDADDGQLVKEEEFKKLLTEILGSLMLQLEGNIISVSTNSVVHEPIASASTILQPSSS